MSRSVDVSNCYRDCGTDHDGERKPRQRDAYRWFTVKLANLRAAVRWAADHGDLDDAATIATYAGWLGYLVENYEPITWAEELIGPARAVDHPRLAALYGGVAVLHDRTDQ